MNDFILDYRELEVLLGHNLDLFDAILELIETKYTHIARECYLWVGENY